MKANKLQTFVKAVNDLARKDAAKHTGIFKGVHHDFPESMLKCFFDAGLTPREALSVIDDGIGM